jgi:excisionase family DNA binding protein
MSAYYFTNLGYVCIYCGRLGWYNISKLTERSVLAEYMKLTEVARRLDVSEKTARRLVKAGKLPSVFIGGAFRVSEEDLAEFLEAAKVDPGKAAASSQLDLNGLLQEAQRAGWEAAVENARHVREDGQGRMEELLSLWRTSKERQEDPSKNRKNLDQMGGLLQRAYDAAPRLFAAASREELAGQWPEVQRAERFYFELVDLVLEAGLTIRTAGEQAAGEPGQWGGRPQAIEDPDEAA